MMMIFMMIKMMTIMTYIFELCTRNLKFVYVDTSLLNDDDDVT